MTDMFDLIIATPGANGPAPATVFSHTARLSKGGTISAELPGNHPASNLADVQRDAELLAGMRSYGAGSIDDVVKRGKTNGVVEIQVSGPDKLAELNKRSVRTLVVGTEAVPVAIATALSAIMALAPPGWTIDTTTHNSAGITISLEFAGEPVLEALNKAIEQVGIQYRLDGTSRHIIVLYKDQPHSGIVATRLAGDAPSADFCLIDGDVEETISSTDVISRIYGYGDGTGKARKTMAGATWPPPAGYTMDTVNSCIIHTATDSVDRIEREIAYKDIKSADQLATAAYEELRTRIAPKREYRLRVTELQKPLLPGMLITLVDRIEGTDGYQAMDINADLVVLEVTTEVNGDRTTADLVVSTSDRWIQDDADMVAKRFRVLGSMESHDQPVSRAAFADSATTTSDANVAKLNTAQTFTAPQTFGNTIAATGNTPAMALGTGAGTGATATISGNNTRGEIVVTAGTGAVATGEIITITFATPSPYTTIPVVLLTPYNSTSAPMLAHVRGDMVTTGAFIVRAGATGLAAGSVYRWSFFVVG